MEGSISNLISSSGGVSGLAMTDVGTTSICGIRILPDSIAWILAVLDFVQVEHSLVSCGKWVTLLRVTREGQAKEYETVYH